MNKQILRLLFIFILNVIFPCPIPSLSQKSDIDSYNPKYLNRNVPKMVFAFNFHIVITFLILSFVIFSILLKLFHIIINSTIYIPFNVDLTLLRKPRPLSTSSRFRFCFLILTTLIMEWVSFTDFVFFVLHSEFLYISFFMLFEIG